MKNKRKFSKNLNQKESQIKIVRIILFILLVVLISVLIFNYSSKFLPSSQKPSSLKDICNSFCETNQRTAFCFVPLRIKEGLTGTCDELSTTLDYSKYNVESCEIISCAPVQLDQTCVKGLGGTWETPEQDGNCPQNKESFSRKVKSSDNPPVSGQICCRTVL